MRIRTQLKAGGRKFNHNEALQESRSKQQVSMRRELATSACKEDRLELLVVRTSLRAGRRRRGRDMGRR